jgi:light-regulated signal transduction histidine kinase (bacteriophytochrome)
VGFNNRLKDKLFGVFKRVPSNLAFPGAGMGLAVVRRLCVRLWAGLGGRPGGSGATFFWLAEAPTMLG